MADQAVIIGGGQAGAQAAQSLRQRGFAGAIVLIGAEDRLPYQRPPLSKAYLAGEMTAERLTLRPAALYENENITLKLDTRVAVIDRTAARVVTAAGETIPYDRLLLATGAPPRRLTCPNAAGLAGVYYLRSAADSDALKAALATPGDLVIIGAGYIGLEVAATARKAGHNVTIVEAAARPLARVAGRELSAFFEQRHRAAGVAFRFETTVQAIDGRDAATGVLLSTGERLAASAVLIGIGAEPATALATAAGLAVENGVVVDEATRTSDPAIFAAGDVANFPSALYGRRLRLESVGNAIEQAKAAAAGMAGAPETYDPTPWFWSDQYDVKLQTAGLAAGADQTVIRGDISSRKFSIWSFAGTRLLAADCVNDPAAFLVARKLIAARGEPSPAALADAGLDLKSFL